MKLDDPVSVEAFRRMARTLIGARGRFVYYIWKVLRRRDWMRMLWYGKPAIGGGLHREENGTGQNPFRVFEEIINENGSAGLGTRVHGPHDERATKELHYCPHMAAIAEEGASGEEMATLCKHICSADRVAASLHPIHLEWVEPTIGEGGQKCIMRVSSR